MNLHKLLIPIGYDNKKQMTNIPAHIHLRVVDHVIIHAYVEYCTRDGYNGRSMTLYHLINMGCFSKLDDLVCNPPLKVLVTCKWHSIIDDNNE